MSTSVNSMTCTKNVGIGHYHNQILDETASVPSSIYNILKTVSIYSGDIDGTYMNIERHENLTKTSRNNFYPSPDFLQICIKV